MQRLLVLPAAELANRTGLAYIDVDVLGLSSGAVSGHDAVGVGVAAFSGTQVWRTL